jgi:hypothetical protein
MDYAHVSAAYGQGTNGSIFITGHFLPGSGTALAAKFVDSVFLGEQLPRSVEIELALLEPRALEQYRALPGVTTGLPNGADHPRQKYLRNNLSKIQIFRQRVPIRAANR